MVKPVHPIITELKAIRRSQKVSQDAVGFALGIQQAVISEWESGDHNPQLHSLSKWADTLGYDVVLKLKD